MMARRFPLFLAVLLGCGGGTSGPQDSGGTFDPGAGVDVSQPRECTHKEDCPPRPCHTVLCSSGVCTYEKMLEGSSCQDLENCIFSGTCDSEGHCQGEWGCDDSNPCTKDECVDGKCRHDIIQSGPCDDGDPCTEGDLCIQGECKPGPKNVCACQKDEDCPPPTDLCLGRLMCDGQTHKCIPDPSAKVLCEESKKPCYTNKCMPSTGQCKEVLLEDGTPCDGGKCVINGQCKAGECIGEPKCTSDNPCLIAQCDEETGECSIAEAPKGTPCDDGNPCTTNDQCDKGLCKGTSPDEVCDGIDNDCDGITDPPNSKGCNTYYWDEDGDGFGDEKKAMCLCSTFQKYKTKVAGDCNDLDAKVNPVAIEVCNNKDDNCDGKVDEEDATGCKNYYFDEDNDGFGISDDFKCLCAPFGSYSAQAPGDCNDKDGGINPSAKESCNYTDDNCNGTTDEGESNPGCTVFYLDEDGDGHGTNASKCLCFAQDKYTAKIGDDCDDKDPKAYPSATEVCNNKDDNCNGSTDEGEGLSGCKNFYEDLDNDGYGAGTPKCLCKASPPYVTDKGGDCGPQDPNIHPGASICGKDADCDGGLKDVNEECDDGNQEDWDGCDNTCKIGEFQVNSYYVDDQLRPDVAFPGPIGNNGYFVVWEGVGCTMWAGLPPKCYETDYGVWLMRFDSQGKAQRLEQVNTYRPGSQGFPRVYGTANGAVVVFSGQGSDTELSEVYARRFNADGTPKDSNVTRVNQITDGHQKAPDVVADSTLAFRVVWQSQLPSGEESIKLRAFTSNLTAWDEMTVHTNLRKYQRNPSIAAFDGGKRFVVVWEAANTLGTDEDIYARRFLWDTNPLDKYDFLVNIKFTTGSQRAPKVAGNLASNGGFVVVWHGPSPGGSDNDVWAWAYDADGNPVVPDPVRVNQVTAGDQSNADVAMASDGSFVVVFTTFTSGTYDIAMRRFNKDQTPKGNEVIVNRFTLNDQALPAIVSASDGTVLVAWSSYKQDGSGFGVFAQRFGPNGERLFR